MFTCSRESLVDWTEVHPLFGLLAVGHRQQPHSWHAGVELLGT